MKKTDPAVIAKKYAKAFFELSKESQQIEKHLTELSLFVEILQKEKLLKELATPLRKNIWQKLQETLEGKISPATSNFLKLLSEMDREALLLEVYNQFVTICDTHFDVARGALVTATEIDPDQIEAMQLIVTEKLGKKVIFEHKHDPNILGGVVAQVGGWTFDDSLKTQLDKINHILANG